MFHLFLFPRGRDCLKFLMIRNGTILGKEEGEMSPSHFICSVICSPFMIGAGRRIRGNNCLIPTSISIHISYVSDIFFVWCGSVVVVTMSGCQRCKQMDWLLELVKTKKITFSQKMKGTKILNFPVLKILLIFDPWPLFYLKTRICIIKLLEM